MQLQLLQLGLLPPVDGWIGGVRVDLHYEGGHEFAGSQDVGQLLVVLTDEAQGAERSPQQFLELEIVSQRAEHRFGPLHRQVHFIISGVLDENVQEAQLAFFFVFVLGQELLQRAICPGDLVHQDAQLVAHAFVL